MISTLLCDLRLTDLAIGQQTSVQCLATLGGEPAGFALRRIRGFSLDFRNVSRISGASVRLGWTVAVSEPGAAALRSWWPSRRRFGPAFEPRGVAVAAARGWGLRRVLRVCLAAVGGGPALSPRHA